jgi:hypothetical protein
MPLGPGVETVWALVFLQEGRIKTYAEEEELTLHWGDRVDRKPFNHSDLPIVISSSLLVDLPEMRDSGQAQQSYPVHPDLVAGYEGFLAERNLWNDDWEPVFIDQDQAAAQKDDPCLRSHAKDRVTFAQ